MYQEHSPSARDILSSCSLRFMCWHLIRGEPPFDPNAAIAQFTETGMWDHVNDLERMTVFSFIQRSLHWNDGVGHPDHYRAWLSLFPLTCRLPVPKGFKGDYYYEWESGYAHRIDECIAIVAAHEQEVLASDAKRRSS